MRNAACLMVVAVATACGSAGPGDRVERYGISLDVPTGWVGEVSRGIVRLQRGDVSVVLHEYETSSPGEAAYFKRKWPVRLVAADFERRHDQDDTALLHSVSGRLFSVFLSKGAPPPDELDELNAALAGIEVEAGDFYPGSVQPVLLPERRGWHAVSSEATPRYAYGESAQSAAATIPFLDGEENAWPPRRTLEALPADGFLIQATLSRSPGLWEQNALRAGPPYRIRNFVRRDCPGKACELPEYLLVAAYGDRYRVELRLYFGRVHPTDAMLTEADAVLRGLRFPDWGPWELESA